MNRPTPPPPAPQNVSFQTSWSCFPHLNLGTEFNICRLAKEVQLITCSTVNFCKASNPSFQKFKIINILVTWAISIFWKDKLQVLIISIHLNKSSSFIDKHPKHGWHKLWWTQVTINDEFFYFKLQGHFNDQSSYGNQETFHDTRNHYLEIKEVIGKILMRQDPQSIYCGRDHKSWRWKSNPTTFKWFLYRILKVLTSDSNSELKGDMF